MFVLLTVLGLASHQIDYTQVFLQADLDDPVYMHVSQDWYYNMVGKWLQQFDNPKYIDMAFFIKLKKNLYGCKQAAHNWYQNLDKGLLAHGFYQLMSDPCFFICNDCMIACTPTTVAFCHQQCHD